MGYQLDPDIEIYVFPCRTDEEPSVILVDWQPHVTKIATLLENDAVWTKVTYAKWCKSEKAVFDRRSLGLPPMFNVENKIKDHPKWMHDFIGSGYAITFSDGWWALIPYGKLVGDRKVKPMGIK
jgi:hypothetical protein